MIEYRDVNSDNPDITRVNDSVSQVLDDLNKNFLLKNPTIVKDLVFTSGVDLVVNHKLGRVVTGYIPIKCSAAVSIFTSTTSLVNPKTQIILKSNATATVSLMFF